jgi:hypothetical protein
MNAAKGLSKLQREILRLAINGKESPVKFVEIRGIVTPIPREVDVYYDQVLAAFYGWPVFSWLFGPTPTPLEKHLGPEHSMGHHFKPSEIGQKQYAAGHAACSRAMRRLEARGIVALFQGAYSQWRGAKLTDTGAEIARRLNAGQQCVAVNRCEIEGRQSK